MPTTEMSYYSARYYDPQIGRFISEDPIRFKGSGTNFYAYVGNDPTILIDPFGLEQCDKQKRRIADKLLSAWHWLDDELGITGPDKGFREFCASQGFAAGPEGCYKASVPPLQIVHNEPPLQQSASYKEWSSKSTQEIIDSLAPNARNPLTVKSDGAIMNGNSRISVLMDRGYDVNSLPRVEYTPFPMPELKMPPIE